MGNITRKLLVEMPLTNKNALFSKKQNRKLKQVLSWCLYQWEGEDKWKV
jgi:hypothetical protein